MVGVCWSTLLFTNTRQHRRPGKDTENVSKLVLKEKYKTDDDSLILLNLDSLKKRRKGLSLKFAKNGIKNKKMDDLFPENQKYHCMETRENEKFKVTFAIN